MIRSLRSLAREVDRIERARKAGPQVDWDKILAGDLEEWARLGGDPRRDDAITCPYEDRIEELRRARRPSPEPAQKEDN